ncbi:MATE family efflux transporter [Arcobacter aquimarinus]|uniref:MATE family efflux protein n=1 Tax=Arcobacter aquimarinus TaxID=1315211 RepID=A0AAE7E0V5_9BACT|nr:MATE family efflux transporter [Arcobacter aquimarinus]QKE24851.1 MATE family efflux protein [Arcobacter aquimarinus]
MKNNQIKLTTQDIPTLLRQLAIPASIGMFFNTMYNVVDTFYAGLISTQAVSALTLSFMVFFLIIGLGYGFSSAITAILGNSFGKKRDKLASIYAHKGVVFIPFIGFILSIIGYIFAPSMFILLGAKKEYLQDAITYINPILFGTIFFMFNFSLNAVLVALGDTKTYRNTLIFGFFANLALNPLFMFGFLFIPAMGLSGIAVATVLIQIINMIYLFYKVYKTKVIHFEKLSYFLPDFRVYKLFLSQGIPSSLNMLIMSIGSVILTYFVAQYGLMAVAGYGIAYRVEQLMLLPTLGLSTAVLTIISNNYGAKKYDRVLETLKVAMKYGFILSTIGIITLTILGKTLIALFDSNEIVVDFGITYLLVEIWIFYAYVVLFICVSTLQAIKKPKMILYIALYRQIVAKLIIAYLIVKIFELDFVYLWIGILIMIYSAAIFAYFYTKNLLKKSCNILL